MKPIQYLTFEINQDCNFTSIHPRCPISHPERYKFGNTSKVLTDQVILDFWLWTRTKGFEGIILWHLYNEPTLVLDRITSLMAQMRVHHSQRFHLWTNGSRNTTLIPPSEVRVNAFNHIQVTNYRIIRPQDLDNRRATSEGGGKPYAQVTTTACTRGYGWEAIIDYHGNWLLCCNDYRCEESSGNIFVDDWEKILERYRIKASSLHWHDEASYNALPRMCRACIDVNPSLHRSAAHVA